MVEVLTNKGVPVDIDRDGDTDLLSRSVTEDVGWNANSGTFPYFAPFTVQTIASSVLGLFGDVHAADIDGDGDSDVLSASDTYDEIEWLENADAYSDGVMAR